MGTMAQGADCDRTGCSLLRLAGRFCGGRDLVQHFGAVLVSGDPGTGPSAGTPSHARLRFQTSARRPPPLPLPRLPSTVPSHPSWQSSLRFQLHPHTLIPSPASPPRPVPLGHPPPAPFLRLSLARRSRRRLRCTGWPPKGRPADRRAGAGPLAHACTRTTIAIKEDMLLTGANGLRVEPASAASGTRRSASSL